MYLSLQINFLGKNKSFLLKKSYSKSRNKHLKRKKELKKLIVTQLLKNVKYFFLLLVLSLHLNFMNLIVVNFNKSDKN